MAAGSGASGPPATGDIQTCIMGRVALLTLPALHAFWLLLPTTVDPLKHRSSWVCHCVRHPPGCGGFAAEAPNAMYMAALKTAPCCVFTYTRTGIGSGQAVTLSARSNS